MAYNDVNKINYNNALFPSSSATGTGMVELKGNAAYGQVASQSGQQVESVYDTV